MRVRNLKGEVVEIPDAESATFDGNGRLTRIERRLVEAEYEVDSLLSHVAQKGCDDVKPRSAAKLNRCRNAVRGAIGMVRLEAGVRHPTLFAGSANPNDPKRSQRQKGWGSHRAHGWRKDCDDDGKEVDEGMVDEELGRGLEAECWFCDVVFVKEEWHEACGLWRCPECGKCGCDLDDFTRTAVEKTYRALTTRGR